MHSHRMVAKSDENYSNSCILSQAVASRKNRTVRSAWIRSVIVWTAAFPFAAFPMAFRVAVDFDTGYVYSVHQCTFRPV